MRRVVLLVPYWSFFEAVSGSDLRARRERLVGKVAAELDAAGIAVERTIWIDSAEAGRSAGSALSEHHPTAIVVMSSMAAPPDWTLTALESVPQIPLVVAAVTDTSPSLRLDHEQITEAGATVGAPQLTNMLGRASRRHVIQYANLQRAADAGALRDRVSWALAAGSLRGARVLRVGDPLPGYGCVDCDEARLEQALGVQVEHTTAAEVATRYQRQASRDLSGLERETVSTFAVDQLAKDAPGWTRSLRMAAALEELDRELDVAAGAMNCHVPELRFASDPGITPCFALGRETTNGVPWTCTGDISTVIAMLTLKRLGAGALYHEIEVLDQEADEALLANSGEHDLSLADPSADRTLQENSWWRDDPVRGLCACFPVASGPATLVAFTEHPGEASGFRYIVAHGAFTNRTMPESGTAHAAFRFADRSVADGWTQWASAGPCHHSAATRGHWGDAIADVASHLGVGYVQVS